MSKTKFFNRDLSWLAFNERVLEEAYTSATPLLERLKFLAISSNNLDEFFMVRVGGLTMLESEGIAKMDPSGLNVPEQLMAISERVHRLVEHQDACYLEQLEPQLAESGIRHLRPGCLTASQTNYLHRYFREEIFPIITPLAVDRDGPFPPLLTRALHICIRLKNPGGTPNHPRVALIQIGPNMDRFITLPGSDDYAFILLEDVIRMFLDECVPGEAVLESVVFRLTHNADMAADDAANDLKQAMEAVLDARKDSECVRLEIEATSTKVLQAYFKKALGITDRDIYLIRGPLDLAAFMSQGGVSGYDELKNPVWLAQPVPGVNRDKSLFDTLSQKDLLLVHPFDTFDPVVRLIEEASQDPDVVAIKQILYRTSRHSPIVSALMQAAEKGKYVTAIVELKARFDEQRNMDWARALERSGVQVIYGVKGYKTHAKICIIVRREALGLRRYMHFGTGNYNEVTANIYTDVSYLTSREDLGADASAFFNTITGYSQPHSFRKLEAAPLTLRDKLLDLINGEIERHKQGHKALIMAKFNSLVDPTLINALYKASNAGVQIQLNVRGICCLRPGVKGLSEHIRVISIVDRYLEHSRIFYFHQNDDPKIYISSADLMPRNLDARIELMIPIEDAASRDRLIHVLETCMKDTVKARILMSDGTYRAVRPNTKRKPLRSQESLHKLAVKTARNAGQAKLTTFEPHRPS
ncbi:MAG: polyphosphate kinase [Kiritimatiellia bacterium]|jgi:polyphosphate kinase